jgi:nucleoside-diphosphate-sugar epimerase
VRLALVTGACGFLGSHLVESLVSDGWSVRALDDGSSGGPANLAAVRDRIELVEADVRDRDALLRAAAGAELVFHLAARVAAEGRAWDPLAGHAVNAAGTLAVLEAARRSGARRVVHASSWRVYGAPAARPLAETLEPRPDSTYAVQKLCGEVYCALYHRLHALDTVSLRYFPIFGPRQRPDDGYAAGVLTLARARARGEAPPPRLPEATAATDLVFVSDAVRATRLAAESERAGGTVLNVGSGRPAGSAPGLADGVAPGALARPQVADPSRARERLGFEARVSVEAGLARTVAWLREREDGRGEARR